MTTTNTTCVRTLAVLRVSGKLGHCLEVLGRAPADPPGLFSPSPLLPLPLQLQHLSRQHHDAKGAKHNRHKKSNLAGKHDVLHMLKYGRTL